MIFLVHTFTHINGRIWDIFCSKLICGSETLLSAVASVVYWYTSVDEKINAASKEALHDNTQ